MFSKTVKTLARFSPRWHGDDGSIFYLKRELQFTEDGIDVTRSSRYIPRLAELLHVADRRGKTVPHHACLQIQDPEATSEDQYLSPESQERCDIQHSVRVLATYMARPTKTAMGAIKRLTSYLVYSKDMKLHYP